MAVDEKKRQGQRQKSDKLRKDTSGPEENKSGFPPHITVDELHFYRKRRPNDWLKQRDHLRIEEGSFKFLKTEYTRRFKHFFEALRSISNGKEETAILQVRPVKQTESLKLDAVHDYQSEYNESFGTERLKRPFHKVIDAGQMDNEISTRPTQEIEPHQSKTAVDLPQRPPITKRPTNLKIEGDFHRVTEYADKFIEYLLAKRAELLRTPTTLKLEGDMETKTETGEQYVKYENPERPPLCRKFSQLHLEGELDNSTEKREKFVPHEVQRRPPLVKKATNLHLEGDLSLIPEYTREYIHYKPQERATPAFPVNHLKAGGAFENMPDKDKLFDAKLHPAIPFLRDFHDPGSHRSSRRSSTRSPQMRLDEPKTLGTHQYLSSGLQRISSHPDITFTKASDSDLSRIDLGSVRDLSRSQGELSPKTTRRKRDSSYTKGNGFLESDLDHKSSFVHHPTDKPEVMKQDFILPGRDQVRHRKEEFDMLPPPSKLGERFECQPEYRKAYRDYLTRERKPPTAPRRRALEIADGDKIEDGLNANGSDTHSSSSQGKPKEPAKDSSSSISSVPTSPRPAKSKPTHLQVSHKIVPPYSPSPRHSPTRRSRAGSRSPSPSVRTANRPRVFSRSPSPNVGATSQPFPPIPRGTRTDRIGSRSPSPNVSFTAHRIPQRQGFSSSWTNGLDDSDPAFVVLRDRTVSKKAIRHNLYKEQKWMPSWNYSTE